ncbi:MAG: leucyl/phenylalanyl-tRNA--protein transferase [Alphaproteobacteria bacterium]
MQKITVELLLSAYASGYFPMADSRKGTELHWFYPEKRGIIPLNAFHIPKSLSKYIKNNSLIYTTNHAFNEVITACATRGEDTWINDEIIELYCQLNELGFAHSVECWMDNTLIGGLYGVSLGGAFFGESMFTRTPNASKCALVHLVHLLKDAGYTLLDTQFVNEHLKQFGVIEISRDEYLEKLEAALQIAPRNCWT